MFLRETGWTLFLDRDGVINRRLPGAYIRHWDEFEWLPGVLDNWSLLNRVFDRLVIVTNQQGIGKGRMTEEELSSVHQQMKLEIESRGGYVDGIYYCPDLAAKPNNCRKPAPAMGLLAQRDFPEIDFKKSVIIGDSISDMQFGHQLGMYKVLITTKEEETDWWFSNESIPVDERHSGLKEWVDANNGLKNESDMNRNDIK